VSKADIEVLWDSGFAVLRIYSTQRNEFPIQAMLDEEELCELIAVCSAALEKKDLTPKFGE
jgi:hypothetical protein